MKQLLVVVLFAFAVHVKEVTSFTPFTCTPSIYFSIRDVGVSGLRVVRKSKVSGFDAVSKPMESSASEKAAPTVLVCTGDACEDVGARDLIKLARRKASETVKCKSTGCLGMCGQGPAIAVQNSVEGALEIHRDVDEAKLDAIFINLQS